MIIKLNLGSKYLWKMDHFFNPFWLKFKTPFILRIFEYLNLEILEARWLRIWCLYVTPKESMQYNIKFTCFPYSKLFINSIWVHIDFILNINNLFFNFWQNNCKNSWWWGYWNYATMRVYNRFYTRKAKTGSLLFCSK